MLVKVTLHILCNYNILTAIIGEFGLVYKGQLFDKDGMPESVAVKTLKGTYALYPILIFISLLDKLVPLCLVT